MTKIEDGESLDIVATPNAGFQPGTAEWTVLATQDGNDISFQFSVAKDPENELHAVVTRSVTGGTFVGVATLTIDADADTDPENVEPLTASYPFFNDGPNSTSIDFTATAV